MTTLALMLLLAQATPERLLINQAAGVDRPTIAYWPAKDWTINYTGTGSWSTSLTGDLANKGDGFSAMVTLSPSSGTGPATITVSTNPAFAAPAGTYQGEIVIGTTRVPVSFQIRVRPPMPVSNTTLPSGCTTTNALYNMADNCPFSTVSPPAVGSSVSLWDGATARRLVSGETQLYSARGTISKTNAGARYVLTTNFTTGTPVVRNLATGTALGSGSLPGTARAAIMSMVAAEAGSYYYTDGNVLHKVTAPGMTDSTIATITELTGASTYEAGATTGSTMDGYAVLGTEQTFSTPPSTARYCVVQLATGSRVCTATSALSSVHTAVDWAGVSELDAETGVRWLVVAGLPAMTFWAVTPTGIAYSHSAGAYDGRECTAGRVCLAQPHAALGLDERGRVILTTLYIGREDMLWWAAYYPHLGENTMRYPRILAAITTNTGIMDAHFSCAPDLRICSIASYASLKSGPTTMRLELMSHAFSTGLTRRWGHTQTLISIPQTGTISATNGSTSITGSGTTFTADWNGRPMYIGTGGPFGAAFTFVSTTAGTLASAYTGSTASGLTFTVDPPPTDAGSYWATPRTAIAPDLPLAFASTSNYGLDVEPSVYVISVP